MARATLDSLLAEPDAIILVALGAVSALARLEPWLERATRDGREPALAPDDPALLAALGMVSLCRTASRWLDLACAGPPAFGKPGKPRLAPAELRR